MAQTAKAVLVSNPDGLKTETVTAPADGSGGDVIQLADGRAAVALGLNISTTAFSAGDPITVATNGVWSFLKTASIVLLKGGQAFWDRSAETATFTNASGDFFLGKFAADAASADTTCIVDLNGDPSYAVELGKGVWTTAATNGLGVTALPGSPGVKLAFDAVAEAAMAAIYSDTTVPVADLGILEVGSPFSISATMRRWIFRPAWPTERTRPILTR